MPLQREQVGWPVSFRPGSEVTALQPAMREGADRHARVYEQVDYGAPNPAGRPGDEHRRHSRPCHEDPGVVRGRRTE
jgi:hypothetical protein